MVPSERYKKIKITNEQKIQVRKKHLFENLEKEKLQYIENSICDQYIKFGLHDIEYIIQNVREKEIAEERRLNRLLKALAGTGTEYESSIGWYYDYIKKGGDLKETVKNGSKEWFYLHKTEYPSLLEKYKNEDLAQSKALQKYIDVHGIDRYIEMIRKDEMIIRINI